MHKLRFKLSVSSAVVLIAFVAFNLAGAMATSRFYPRPNFSYSAATMNGHQNYIQFEDGSLIFFTRPINPDGRLGSLTAPYVLNPPQPSLLHAWCPVFISATSSILIFLLAVSLNRLPLGRAWRMLLVSSLVIVGGWIAMTGIRIAGNPKYDYHVHPNLNPKSYFKKVVHVTPLWPRFWRLLLGRPWPGDYRCPIPPDVSMERPASAQFR